MCALVACQGGGIQLADCVCSMHKRLVQRALCPLTQSCLLLQASASCSPSGTGSRAQTPGAHTTSTGLASAVSTAGLSQKRDLRANQPSGPPAWETLQALCLLWALLHVHDWWPCIKLCSHNNPVYSRGLDLDGLQVNPKFTKSALIVHYRGLRAGPGQAALAHAAWYTKQAERVIVSANISTSSDIILSAPG